MGYLSIQQKYFCHLLILIVVAVDGYEWGHLRASGVNLAEVHAMLVGIQRPQQTQQAQRLLPDNSSSVDPELLVKIRIRIQYRI